MKHRTNLPSTRRRARLARLARVAVLGLVSVALGGIYLPTSASAHPLGNFTINHYNGLTIGVERVQVDHVLDMAEIPALQARQTMGSDADGAVSEAESVAWAETTCRSGSSGLRLNVNGAAVALTPTARGLTFPPGQAGLVTLRLVCTYEGTYAALGSTAAVEFRDTTYEGRPGWREIVVRGDGLTLAGADEFAVGSSDRLRSYPSAMLEAPRAQPSAAFTVTPGGMSSVPEPVTDAVPFGSGALVVTGGAQAAAMPGGAELPPELSAIIQAQDLTLPAVGLSLALAVLIGAVHAASPGHGKTLMAAYLVGTRGTVRHALGLGLTVTVAHTIGVLALGAVVLFAGAVVPSEQLFPILGLVSGLVVTALGVALLIQRITDERRRRRSHAHDHAHGHEHDHPHHDDAEIEPEAGGWHSHGLVRHTHLPQGENPLRWRNLVALGLIGGLVPSASAILILVGSIAAGRPAYGMILTLAFGIGMAVVLVGVGVLLVRARSLVERLPNATRLAPLFAHMPLVTAGIFLLVGGTITLQAAAQL